MVILLLGPAKGKAVSGEPGWAPAAGQEEPGAEDVTTLLIAIGLKSKTTTKNLCDFKAE